MFLPAMALLLAASASGQAPRQAETKPVTQPDAVVTDARGRHVTDLGPEDFEILQDGRPQKITRFPATLLRARARPCDRAARR